MDNQSVRDFAKRITSLGFRVFVARDGAGQYGVITDEAGARVLSFSFTDGGSLGGNYGPPSHESGTGWRLERGPESLRTAGNVREALNEMPPAYCGRGWKRLSTLDDHLALYGLSSRYAEVVDA